MAAVVAESPPSCEARTPCRAKHKSIFALLLAFIVISLGNETRILKSVSNDRREVTTTVANVSERNATPKETANTSGTFNNVDIIYRGPNRTFFSTAECIGESFTPYAWMYRSCLYRNLCFDMSSNEFVLFQSPVNKRMETIRSNTHLISSSLNTTVSLGGFVSTWRRDGQSRLEWSPKIVDPSELLTSGYYELMGDTVLIPFHTLAAQNVGHFVWDNLLPIYALQSLFGLSDVKLVLLRYILDGKPLPFTCEGKFIKGCEQNFERLLPMVGVSRSAFSSTRDAVLHLTNGERQSNYVCSSLGAAGIGHLTDHGMANHGKRTSDYEHMHNHGRGPVLFDFRNYILNNLNMQHLPDRVVHSTLPFRITFSIHSSGRDHRNLDFGAQIAALKNLSNPNIVVEAYQFSKLTMEQEIEVIASSHILITACGGGAVSSMFLPRGASLVMFYAEEKEGIANAKLDFDYVNNMGYVRTHWLPTNKMNDESSMDAFVALIQHEIEVMSLQ